MSTSSSRRLETRAAAEYVGLAPATLEKGRVTGRPSIPFLKLGRRVLYDTTDLDAYLDQHRRRSTSDAGPNAGAGHG